MNREKRTKQLKWQLVGVVLTCWLIPVALILSVIGSYLLWTQNIQTSQNYSRQFSENLKMSAGKLESAIEASRIISYSPAVKNAWQSYRDRGIYADLFRETGQILDWQYRNDSRFRLASVCFLDDPNAHNVSVVNEYSGATQDELRLFESADLPGILSFAEGLDTSVGFYVSQDRVYIVRNLKDSYYENFAVFSQALNNQYYFDNLEALEWADDLTVELDGGELHLRGELSISGDAQEQPGTVRDGYLFDFVTGAENHVLKAMVRVDFSAMRSQYTGYAILLAAMLLILVPVILYAMRFIRRSVQGPVDALLEAAGRIAQGEFGYMLEYEAGSREFAELVQSFNGMSGQLLQQFKRLYQEELAVRDARIKALQNYVNPRFLSNTLQIISWQAKLTGEAKVSRMLDSLMTLLEAMSERDSAPEISLNEEMNYVVAYLNIVTASYGKRLVVNREITDEALWYGVPRLILQPLVENAIEHGIDALGSGVITIRGYVESGSLVIEVENDGAMDEEEAENVRVRLSPDYEPPSGSFGIASVNARLRMLYGDESGLEIASTENDSVIARIRITPNGKVMS